LSKSVCRLFCRASRFKFLSAPILLFLLILSAGKSLSSESESCGVPGDYGEVVCRYNEKSSNHLYVIGIAHRDSLTRSNGSLTPRVQAEVYKIGEWLIQNQGVELLLPEGFFVTDPNRPPEKTSISNALVAAPQELDMGYLERRFSNGRQFVNAEMLLRSNFPLLLRQVEDKDLYQAVFENIRLLAESSGSMEKNFLIRSELDYQQKRRVGAMLQRIPAIVNDEFRQGRIGSRKAVFTIGLSHVADIINYLRENRVSVLSPLFTALKHEDYVDSLSLAKEDFGVSVIVPRTLINDHEVMERNNLKAF